MCARDMRLVFFVLWNHVLGRRTCVADEATSVVGILASLHFSMLRANHLDDVALV